jgi:hypothetical protein
MDIVEIVWFDAQSSLQQLSIKEAKKKIKPLLTKTIGYKIHENNEYILIAFMKNSNDIFKHWQVIPKGIIKESKTIKNDKMV